MRLKTPKGFTMIELMIVVAIIGILAAIALPKFADLLEKSREGNTKGNIGVLRSASSIYYGDQKGEWPETLNTADAYRFSLYIDGIPEVKVTGKFDANRTSPPKGIQVLQVAQGVVPTSQSSGWMYDSSVGYFYVNSTLRDSRKVAYSFYAFE